MLSFPRWCAGAAALLTLAVGAGVTGAATAPPPATELAALGRRLFFDPSLSASGKLSCASCHDAAHAYGPGNALAVQLGGPHLDQQGLRAPPSLRYVLNRTPSWFKEYQANPIERMIDTDSVPTGGLTRDGRFDTLRAQAREPLLAANEMANRNAADVVGKLRKAGYRAQFEQLFGAGILDRPDAAFDKLLVALERFELDDPSFRPYSSKFDLATQGKATLSAAEERGQRLFADPQKGNCASCHIATPGADGSAPLFTDFSFAALGVPRNPKLAVNADPRFYDLGLCGPLRRDQRATRSYCGMFKTPSLRNVAARKVFMHNGVFTDLADAVRFYATRDSDSATWYPRDRQGRLARYDDLPPALRDNIDVIDAPLDHSADATPALSEAEVQDIVAFLRTLTDADVRQ